MSDDTCSKCDDLTCPFYGYSDNCYRNSIREVKTLVSDEDKAYFEEVVKKCDTLYEKTDHDDFRQISFSAQRILDLIGRE